MQYWTTLCLAVSLAGVAVVEAETRVAVYLNDDGESPQVAWVLPSVITSASSQGVHWRKVIWHKARTGYIKVTVSPNDFDVDSGVLPHLPLPPLKLTPLVSLLER